MEPETMHQGWNLRNVDFIKAHGKEKEAFEVLLTSMQIKNGMTIGDIMSGYGAVSKEVLDYCANNKLFVKLVLSDAFREQIDKSNLFLAPYDLEGYEIERRVEDARYNELENKLDIAVMKMGLHEVPKKDQLNVLQNVYRAMKDNGSLFLWESFGQTPEINEYFRVIVRKKDELAGYTSFVENRYFSNEPEIVEILRKAKFRNLEEIYCGTFNYSTRNLLESDFLGDKLKLHAWNKYLRATLPEVVRKEINYRDNSNSISMDFTKKIFKVIK